MRKHAIVRNAFFIYIALLAVMWIGGLPLSLAKLQTPCPTTNCGVQMNTEEFNQFVAAGGSLPFYANYMKVVIFLLDTLVGTVMAILLFTRRPNDRTALLLAIPMVSHSFNYMGHPALLRESYPWLWPLTLLPVVAITTLWLPAFSLLPDGQWVPKWSRWLVPYIFVLGFVGYFGHLFLPDTLLNTIVQSAFGANFLLVLMFQVWRFIRSTPTDRVRVKWVLTGILASFLAQPVTNILIALIPEFSRAGSVAWYIMKPLAISSPILMYLCIWIAVLRYKLFDIDLIIRRTLVYSILTGMLGLVYFGSVALLQGVVSAGETAAGSPPTTLIIVMTTLIIAALFTPLRRRIQDFIDRRFYRQKYDAEKALADFAVVARSETNLEQVLSKLAQTTQETLQPSKNEIWIAKRG